MDSAQFFSGSEPSAGRPEEEASRPGRLHKGLTLAILIGGPILLIIAIGALVVLLRKEAAAMVWGSALLGVVCLLIGVIAIGLLMVLARSLGLGTRLHAFGLPPNSARAILAVSTFVVFLFVGLTVYNDLDAPSTAESTGLTQAEIDALPSELRGRITKLEALPGTEPKSFDVTIAMPHSTEAADIGKQMVTAVITLLAAMSAFYFGTRAASKNGDEGTGKEDEAASGNPLGKEPEETK